MNRLVMWAGLLLAWAVASWVLVADAKARAHAAGYAQAMAEVREVGRAAQSAADEAARRDVEKVKEAQDAREKQAAKLAADNGRLRSDVDRLREQIAGASGDRVSTGPADAGGCDCAAERELQRVLGEELARVSAAGAGLAQQCDGHADDSLMLQRAWPE